MNIAIQSNTDSILELPGLPGTLGPRKTTTLPAMTEDLVRAVDLGLLLVPSGAEAPEGLPPVIFEHHYPQVLPVAADRAYYVRVLRAPGGFQDGTALRDFIAYYGDGDGMSCAFSDDGINWDNEKEVTGIAAGGYHVVCTLETSDRLRILYWDPNVPNQPYAMAGLRSPGRCVRVQRRRRLHGRPCHRGKRIGFEPRPLWALVPLVQPGAVLRPRQAFHLALRHVFYRLDGRQRQPRSGILGRRVGLAAVRRRADPFRPDRHSGLGGSERLYLLLPRGAAGRRPMVDALFRRRSRKRGDRLCLVLGPHPLDQGRLQSRVSGGPGAVPRTLLHALPRHRRRRLFPPLPLSTRCRRLSDFCFAPESTVTRLAGPARFGPSRPGIDTAGRHSPGCGHGG